MYWSILNLTNNLRQGVSKTFHLYLNEPSEQFEEIESTLKINYSIYDKNIIFRNKLVCIRNIHKYVSP